MSAHLFLTITLHAGHAGRVNFAVHELIDALFYLEGPKIMYNANFAFNFRVKETFNAPLLRLQLCL
jgi:hypothetical protein